MDFIERVTRRVDKFTPADQKIADYLLQCYPCSLLESSATLADTLKVNVSIITRFFRKIGGG